jgi:uncharacterized circularly permuted ATP-grasp superfamily protein
LNQSTFRSWHEICINARLFAGQMHAKQAVNSLPTVVVVMIQETGSRLTAFDSKQEARTRPFLRRSSPAVPCFEASCRVQQSAPSVSWDLIERGLAQRFEALQVFMERIAGGRVLPASLQISTDSAIGGQLRRLIPGSFGSYAASQVGALWTWFGSTDLLLTADGSISVVDQDFSLPTGLERLSGAAGCSMEAAADAVRTALFPDGVNVGGEEAFMLEPPHPGAAGEGNAFLARCMQIDRVHRGVVRAESGGLKVLRNGRWATVRSLVRRVEDELLDPNCLHPTSLVGVPGLVDLWSGGRLSLVNAPGSGLFRLRSLLRIIPVMIREFLGQEPLLNTVEVLDLNRPSDLERVLRHPQGYMLRPIDPLDSIRSCCGRTAEAAELERVLERVRRTPGGWCARSLLPRTISGDNFRVFASNTDRFRILPMGLLRSSEADGGASPLIPADAAVNLLT